MRILVAHPGPQFSVHDVFVGWSEALRSLGVDVHEFNLDERLCFYDHVMLERDSGVKKALTGEQATELAVSWLYSALYQIRPHVLLCVSGFFYPHRLLDMARSYGTKVVMLHTESPYEDGRQMQLAEHADLNMINDPTNLATFQTVAPTWYVPHSYRPHVHTPGPAVPKLTSDFAFVGTGYGSRIQFLEAMDFMGVDVLLAGNWKQLTEESPLRPFVMNELDECLDNTDTVDVYRSTQVGLNLYRREAENDRLSFGHSMGPREVEMAATGLFFLRDSRKESDEVLGMLPSFTTPGDASEKLRYWLARPEQRKELAARAREAVADRTFTNRAAELLRWLDNKEN